MVKIFASEQRKKRAVVALSVLLSASFSLGLVSACTPQATEPEEETPSTVSTADTQLLKNGNFEFYSERDEEFKDKRDFISSPDSWSFSSGSPSSETASGIIRTDEWGKYSVSTHSLIPESARTDADGKEVTSGTLTDAVASDAIAHWDEASIYDRLEFYDFYKIDSQDEFSLYDDNHYSIDFNDVEYLNEVKNLGVHENAKEDEKGLLMIHNHRTSDGVRGTAQYYTSSTSITLSAGTAAEVSVWVRTSNLYHYAAGAEPTEDVEVKARAGAYIGVSHTIGSTTEQMQIKNIITGDGWEQYTIYVRANPFASTSFRMLLGLGQGSSDNRYEAVDGYAFFDDVTCKIISNEEYVEKVGEDGATLGANFVCGLNDKVEDKTFDRDDVAAADKAKRTYALDLHADFGEYDLSNTGRDVTFGLTKEVSGSKTYTSADIDKGLLDNRSDTAHAQTNSIVGKYNIGTLETAASNNNYLKKIFADDFKEKFPFDDGSDIILLLSTNGAAYTATLPEETLAPKTRTLISFYVKTSSIRTGASGAGATLVDGENKTSITPFDSTTVATVDIEGATDEETVKDINKGWVQCFFFVENDTEEAKTFHIELTYGVTAIASSSASAYADGYAAFANFETTTLNKTQYSYAATGTYAQKVSLTASVRDSSKFDDPSANGHQLEEGLALPANYTGVLADSNALVETEKDADGNITNRNPISPETLAEKGIYAGLLSDEHADKYFALENTAWKTVLDTASNNAATYTDWWKNIFGNGGTSANAAYQPLVIVNAGTAASLAYGFFAKSATFAANSTNKVSVRVKLSQGATANLYLTDTSDVSVHSKFLAPSLPTVTYWYDDDGNIVKGDPTADTFDETTDILYRLQPNGLYLKEGDTSGTYYANLSAFERDDAQNYVTTDKTIAFYYNSADQKAYAYYNNETEQYSTPVTPLPTDAGVRYTFQNLSEKQSVITVTGTADNADQWVTLSFYVKTGNEAKDYRFELWAGSRTCTEEDKATQGIPAGGYVFFDRCSTSTVSNYDDVLRSVVEARKEQLNAGKNPGDNGYVGAKDNLPDALYYTFTFFDSPDYLRYDTTLDEEELGNPWGSYEQSSKTESLAWLSFADADGTLLGAAPSAYVFLDYSVNEVTVTPDELGTEDTDTDTDTDTTAPAGDANIWLLLSSILLAVALVFAIVMVIGRRLYKKYHKTTVKVEKPKKVRKAKKEKPQEEPAEEKEPVSEERDENDPYNE